MLAHAASTGFALRRLGDRARLLNFLVARLRQKVRPPRHSECAGLRWGRVAGAGPAVALGMWPAALPVPSSGVVVRSCCFVSVRCRQVHGEAW